MTGIIVHETARVSKTAHVGDEAAVLDRARVDSYAEVYGSGIVAGDAVVYGYAQVYGRAKVSGSARVCGNADIYGNAKVRGNARIEGNARVYGFALVDGWAHLTADADVFRPCHVVTLTGLFIETVTVFRTRGGDHKVTAGCQTFQLTDDLAGIAATHGWALPEGWEALRDGLLAITLAWKNDTV